MKTLLSTFIIILCIHGITACKKDTIIDSNPCEYGNTFTKRYDFSKQDDGLIPMSFYNYWVYADTLKNIDGTYVSAGIDTIWSGNLEKTGVDFWWTLRGDFLPARKIHLENDGVYTLNYGSNGCSSKYRSFFEGSSDTIFDFLVSGDIAISRKVYLLGETLNTPAGNFVNCTVFNQEDFNTYKILKPGIGFVKYVGPYDGNLNRERTLIDYHIQ